MHYYDKPHETLGVPQCQRHALAPWMTAFGFLHSLATFRTIDLFQMVVVVLLKISII